MRSDKRPSAVTMADVAQRAGVSRALVSIVFRNVPGASPATRERVMLAAEELGYRPDQRARLLGSNRSRTIGVAFGLHHEFHAEVVEGLYGAVEGSGYDLALGAVAPSRDEGRAVQSLLDYRCEALVLLGPTLPRASLEELAERLPVVVVARALRSRTVDVVRSDDVTGARLAVEHLAGLGHERITHVHGQRAPGAAERRRGYRNAMRTAGLDSQIRLVPGGLTEEDGERAAAVLLADPPPTAVTAFNDHCAAGLMAAVRAHGRRGAGRAVGGGLRRQPRRRPVERRPDHHRPGRGHARELGARPGARAHRGPGRGGREVVVPPRLVTRRTTASPA